MNRPLVSIAAILVSLAPALAQAAGLLIVESPNVQVRLPRPIVIWPPEKMISPLRVTLCLHALHPDI